METKPSAKPTSQKEPIKRPGWDEYFLSLIHEIGKRATCDRGKSASIIAKNKRIICTGYVGSPPGFPHCDEVGHLLKKTINEEGEISQHCVRTLHAEQNAIIQAAKYGTPIEGTTLYCTMEPCRVCAMMIIAAGIKRVVCQKRYHAGQETREMFKTAGIVLDVMEDRVMEYEHQ